MSFKQVTESGQPKNLYDHPRELPELIFRQLGVYIGFISFQHNFQGLTNLLMFLKLLRTIEDEDIRKDYKMLVNEHTKIPIKTKLDREALDRLEQVWERGGYLLTRYQNINENFVDIVEEKYLYSYPDWELTENEEISRIPSLFGLKAKDEVSSENFLIRINEGVPEREAYRNQDPRWLCENGHLEYESNGVIIPYFKNYNDILNSTFYTQEVPRLYHDLLTTIAWRESIKPLTILHANIWKMAQELESVDILGMAKKEMVKRVRMESA